MDDITPGLLEKIMKEYSGNVGSDSWIQAFIERVTTGHATAQDASLYARALGEYASQALVGTLTQDVLPDGTLYYNIAEKTVTPLLTNVWQDTNSAAIQVQNTLNKAEGVNIKAISGEFPADRIERIISGATQPGIDFSVAQNILSEPVANTCQSFYDDFVQANAKKTSKSGTYTPTIVRTAESGACKWCRNLAGSWNYGEQPDDVWRRHDNCRCTVTFKNGKFSQDAWSKAQWQESKDRVQAILSKEDQLAQEATARAFARATRADGIAQIQKVLRYSDTGASKFYNQYINEINKYGIDYVIDAFGGKKGG